MPLVHLIDGQIFGLETCGTLVQVLSTVKVRSLLFAEPKNETTLTLLLQPLNPLQLERAALHAAPDLTSP